MYEDLWMNDTVYDKNFNYGFEFQSPKNADACQGIKQAVGMCKFFKQRAANAFVNPDLFHSYHDYFLQNYTIKSIKCQHNPYLGSIKTSIMGKKLGKFQNAYIYI